MSRQHIMLQKRDYALLKALSDYRYLTTSQVRMMFFNNGTFIYRRLRKLANFDLITRLQREVVGQSSELVYALTSEGARQLSLHLGCSAASLTVHRKASRTFLEHELALNEFRLAFEQGVQNQKDLCIEQWDTKRKLRISGKDTLIPDAYIELSTPRGKAHFFVELDRYTESISRVFRGKLEIYSIYHKSDAFTRQSNAKFFRVLIVTVHEQAASALLAAGKDIASHALFWFTHRGLVTDNTVLTHPIWKRADQPEASSSLYTPP